MIKVLISVLLGLTLMGCSSSSDSKPAAGGGGVVTEFGNKTAGQWLSECTQSEGANYKETLVINNNGSGNTTLNFYQDRNCEGQIAQTQGPTAFNYIAEAAVNGVSKVNITIAGQKPIQVNVFSQNNTLEITSEQGTVRYARIGQAPQAPVTIPGSNDFDTLARGNWVSENCYQYENNQTVRQVLTIRGNGQGAIVLNVYPSADCSGTPRPEQKQDITYTVSRFSNGGGEISVNGQANDVSFKDNRMTVSSAQETTTFIKIN